MSPPAADANSQAIDAGHESARPRADRTGPQVAANMDAEDRRHVVERSPGDHRGRPAGKVLLRGLKNELDRLLEQCRMFLEQHGGAQQHRGMAIMPAGVHTPLDLGRVLDAGLFGDGQRVDVGPQRDGLSRTCFKPCGDAMYAADLFGRFVSQLAQLTGDEPSGLFFVVGEFRIRVQMPSPGDDSVGDRLRVIDESFIDHVSLAQSAD